MFDLAVKKPDPARGLPESGFYDTNCTDWRPCLYLIGLPYELGPVVSGATTDRPTDETSG
jgi:hypothetical protein